MGLYRVNRCTLIFSKNIVAMKLKILQIISLVCLFNTAHAQQVIASAGGENFTIGEVVTSTLSTSNNTLTQGFHQPYFGIVNIVEYADIGINVFPNPTQGFIQIVPQEDINARVILFDARGRALINQAITGESTIDLTSFRQGEYSIIIRNQDQVIKTVKILIQR
tara:strand:- start:534 stop:1028 length:495 start_codon:yes stop_codon:yes gene_type:complete